MEKITTPNANIGGKSLQPLQNVDNQQEDLNNSSNEVIRQLSLLKPLEYDRVRKEQAGQLSIRSSTLDAEVKALRSNNKEAGQLPFPIIATHPDPINPELLLNEISATIHQFIVLDEHQAHAAALWCALTYFIDEVEVAPLIIINAPEKSCGKTQLLNVMGRLSYRPLPASNSSASALFRAVELWKPTILIDEADTFFKENFELHGMVNAGYLKGGFVLRSESAGDSYEPKMFSVYAAKALAGIRLEKHLPDATMSRGIVINLRRKLSGESVDRLRHADPDLFTGLASKLLRFAEDYSQQVRKARPVLPESLSDREQDNWDGMLAIASCASEDWINKATASAIRLSENASENSASSGNELLSDIQSVFESQHIDKISTSDLIKGLCADEEAPWSTYNRGKPIAARQLVKQLAAYEIKPNRIRLNSINQIRGFELFQFNDAFKRYLNTPISPVSVSQIRTNPVTIDSEGVTDNETQDTSYVCVSLLQTSNSDNVTDVTDEKVEVNTSLNDNVEYF